MERSAGIEPSLTGLEDRDPTNRPRPLKKDLVYRGTPRQLRALGLRVRPVFVWEESLGSFGLRRGAGTTHHLNRI